MEAALTIPPVHDAIDSLVAPAANPIVLGQDEVRRFLARAWREQRLHHALLFEGPQGIGKATVAFHLANHILGRGPKGAAEDILPAPDPATPLFRQIASGTHQEVLHITRPQDPKTGQFRTAITIEEIRRVTHLLTRTAHDGGWRVVIIDPAEDMNRNAANALLKTLEEPPARALFVLVSHSAGRLLPTIRSRCQAVRFEPLGPENLGAAITRLGVLQPGAATLPELVVRSEGSVRKAALLLLYGGIEIAETVDRVLDGPVFDVARAQALAQNLTGREAGVQYDLFLEHLMGRIAARALDAARAGSAAAADRWSGLWQALREDAANSAAFNLDRKQTVLILLDRARRAFAG
jgi:DNA polymerase III subunit delta'